MVTVDSKDKLELGYQYKAKLHLRPFPVYRIDLWGWRCKIEYQLRLSGVLCTWEETDEEDKIYMYYQLYREEDITHSDVFQWCVFVYDRISCLSRVQLGFDPEAIPGYIRLWTDLWTTLKYSISYWYVGVIILLATVVIPWAKRKE